MLDTYRTFFNTTLHTYMEGCLSLSLLSVSSEEYEVCVREVCYILGWLSVALCILSVALSILCVLLYVVLKKRIVSKASKSNTSKSIQKLKDAGKHTRTVGFFHPYCNAGGGGERVLWCAVNAIHKKYSDVHCVIYTGDIDATRDQIFKLALDRFGVNVDHSRTTFVFMKTRHYVEAEKYPRFTMLGQSLGSLVLGMEAICEFVPDYFIDSMGYAFTLPLFYHLGGCEVGAYVHYPTISTDMLARVQNREAGFNNDSNVSRSVVLSWIKIIYYRLFAFIYGCAGSYCSVVMVNSTWTNDHIVSLWKKPKVTCIVYPPCDTQTLEQFALEGREQTILSVAQFRPEKDHAKQIKAFALFLKNYPNKKGSMKLVMIGGCRNAGDQARVAALEKIRSDLNLTPEQVQFKLNLPYEDLKTEFANALIGIHTMKDEHFGIGVVEFMAAGPVTLAHNSAGPRLDIVTNFNNQQTGYLASTVEEYAEAINTICNLSQSQRLIMLRAARQSVASRFSESVFEQKFVENLELLFNTRQ